MEIPNKLTEAHKELLLRFAGQGIKDRSKEDWAKTLNVSLEDFNLHFKKQVVRHLINIKSGRYGNHRIPKQVGIKNKDLIHTKTTEWNSKRKATYYAKVSKKRKNNQKIDVLERVVSEKRDHTNKEKRVIGLKSGYHTPVGAENEELKKFPEEHKAGLGSVTFFLDKGLPEHSVPNSQAGNIEFMLYIIGHCDIDEDKKRVSFAQVRAGQAGDMIPQGSGGSKASIQFIGVQAHKAKIEELEKNHAEGVAELKELHQKEIEQLTQSHQEQLRLLKDSHSMDNVKALEVAADLQAQVDKAQTQIKNQNLIHKGVLEELAVLERSFSAMEKKYNDAVAELGPLQRELERTQSKLEEEQNRAGQLQKELDDLRSFSIQKASSSSFSLQ